MEDEPALQTLVTSHPETVVICSAHSVIREGKKKEYDEKYMD